MSRVMMNLAAAQLNVGEKGIMEFSGEAMHLDEARIPEYTQEAFLTQQYENVMDNTLEMNEMEAQYPGRTRIVADKDLSM